MDLELDICVWLLVQSSNIFLKLNKLHSPKSRIYLLLLLLLLVSIYVSTKRMIVRQDSSQN